MYIYIYIYIYMYIRRWFHCGELQRVMCVSPGGGWAAGEPKRVASTKDSAG